ncbi:MAG: hypothetical protein WC302_00940 [Candidatus Paceibacterota bacterium]|jgi:hypothetical protein
MVENNIGPNKKKLIFQKMALDAIPPRDCNVTFLASFKAGMEFLSDKNKISESFREALKWFDERIALLRSCPQPNPWSNSTDEEIAGEILRRVEANVREKKAEAKEQTMQRKDKV